MSRALTTSPALVLPTNTRKLAREFSNDGRHVFARARACPWVAVLTILEPVRHRIHRIAMISPLGMEMP
ncbi:hypothetical protein N7527_004027 [Penicillium freii]|nr:hypothetical protein N7527_004027 [Penicillium freii]